MTQRYAYFATFLLLAALAITPQPAQAQEPDPMTLDQVVRMIESGVFSDTRIIALARENCLAFHVRGEEVRRLVDAGGSEALVGALRDVCVKIPQVVTYVAVAPSEVEVPVGANRIVRATALSPDSSEILGVTFQWSVEDTSIADVSAGGTVLGKRPGRTRVVASTLEGPTGSAALTVVRRAAGAAEEEDEPEVLPPGAKSVGTAAALGVLVPGGGELYTGSTMKGVGIIVGSAAAVAVGALITTKDTTEISFTSTGPVTGPSDARSYPANAVATGDETNYIVVGAAVAGALWLYGLVDGIMAAKKSRRAPVEDGMQEMQGLSVQIVPIDGIRIGPNGYTEITLIRIGS